MQMIQVVELFELHPGRFVLRVDHTVELIGEPRRLWWRTPFAIALPLCTWIELLDPEHEPRLDVNVRFLDQADVPPPEPHMQQRLQTASALASKRGPMGVMMISSDAPTGNYPRIEHVRPASFGPRT